MTLLWKAHSLCQHQGSYFISQQNKINPILPFPFCRHGCTFSVMTRKALSVTLLGPWQ